MSTVPSDLSSNPQSKRELEDVSISTTSTLAPTMKMKTKWRVKAKTAAVAVAHHVRKHTGVGIVCAVAYFDPGNWGVDLQAGSQYGYRLLFVVLLAGMFAVFLQVLASRLGCVTGLDLASHIRLLFHSRPKNTLLYRWLVLYPLYVLSEFAIIATDLAELLGSAIALCMLFPKLQLWHGVLLTAADVLLLLAFGDPLRGRPVRVFEWLIAALVLAVLICMVIIIASVDVEWGKAFEGYLPSKHVFSSGALYTSVGILGATVMPHSLFLGSALATQDRISPVPPSPPATPLGKQHDVESSTSDLDPDTSKPKTPQTRIHRILHASKKAVIAPFLKPLPSLHSASAGVRSHADVENRPWEVVRGHIYHGVVDVVLSLLGFAVLINSLILILASAVFFYGTGSGKASNPGETPASLFDAYDLIRDHVGQGAATLFAVALLSAGQSSSIIATLAGQAVSEGFLQWRVSPALRRIITRLIALVPSLAVAAAVGRSGIDALLVASQVVLALVLPFVALPLVWLTSSRVVMQVRKKKPQVSSSVVEKTASPISGSGATAPPAAGAVQRATSSELESAPEDEIVDFSSGKIATAVGLGICTVVIAANVYVIVSLARGT